MTIVAAGIDVSKKTLNIHLNGRDDTAANDRDGFRKVARILRDGGAERVVLEATGRMHRALFQSLHDRGFPVCVVNPRQSLGTSPGPASIMSIMDAGRRQGGGRLRGHFSRAWCPRRCPP